MFAALGWKTLIVFAYFNVAVISLAYFVPETANRSLEEINLLFSFDNPLVSANEREYDKMIAEANSDVAVTECRLLDSVDVANSEKDSRGETGASKSGIPHNTTEDECQGLRPGEAAGPE